MMNLVTLAITLLHDKTDRLDDFGRLLNEQWLVKKQTSSQITNGDIDAIYQAGMNAGALGGKLLVAGVGGFILFFVKPELQIQVRQVLRHLLYVPASFDHSES